ncbi:MAG: ribose-phosphate pyrophosphokinase [Balneola sp.]|jgi:ribose-phosphate pyrophosphokinase|nr:ribose-phosphate pyrophosphokinase [Balneola sp.]MAK38132.1 ribose-phosphate pyrophosphokinase [Flavobacteriaceae bacterium]MBR9917944.1 ribose-phosphate pyrophosphokinase [bacterium]MAO77547.1 ribose-phosphate pyrophosphokinase [Balneola sp.]MBF63846.1 ribose-phosphate pyrophosphokinase [Balneola sp.]|tara:strand:- start:22676 stop:23608 length:933 start_codon:yes stop_codon:yes gene_type:complete
MDTPLAIFSGRSNPALARAIAESYGTKLGDVTIKEFSDGELYVKFEQSIRGEDIFIIQPTPPPGDNIMELLLMLDAAKRASVKRVTAVIPYFGYARQDRKDQPRVSIGSKLMANLLVEAGADRILTMDLHAAQIQGFFDIPLDHLYASRAFIEHFKSNPIENLVVVAPDVGSLKTSRSYSKKLGTSLAFIDKRRPNANESEIMNIIGDVEGKNVLIVDDLIDTAGTLTNAAAAMKERGALNITAICTHPILSGPAYQRIEDSPIDEVLVTDTVTLRQPSDKIKVLSVADIFAEAIQRIHTNDTISALFDN